MFLGGKFDAILSQVSEGSRQVGDKIGLLLEFHHDVIYARLEILGDLVRKTFFMHL